MSMTSEEIESYLEAVRCSLYALDGEPLTDEQLRELEQVLRAGWVRREVEARAATKSGQPKSSAKCAPRAH